MHSRQSFRPSSQTTDAPVADNGTARRTVCAVGVDVGSSNTKIALIAVGPDRVVQEAATRVMPTPDDVSRLLENVTTGIRAVTRLASTPPVAVGIASMAETGVPLDGEYAALSPLIRWNGDRDRRPAETLFDRIGKAELARATGVPPAPKVPLAMWAWMRQERPELWAALARWAGVADLVCHHLSGELVTDHTLAARSMAYRLPPWGADLPHGFAPEILGEVGLDHTRLARIARPGEAAGGVLPNVAERTGLRTGTPVFVAGHDHAVAAWAAGVRGGGDVADSIGTAEALVRVLSAGVDRVEAVSAGMNVGRTVTGAHESLMAGMTAGALIGRWPELAPTGPGLDGVLDGTPDAKPDAKPDAEPAGGPDHAVWSADLPQSPGAILVLPYLHGRQSPTPDPDARLQIISEAQAVSEGGATAAMATAKPAQLYRGLLEGLSLQLRWMDAEQRRLTGLGPAHPLVIVGGPGATNSAWLGIKSAVLAVPLCRVAASEPVAAGAALLALVRAGHVPADSALASTEVTRPDAEAIDVYRTAYERFVAFATMPTT